MKKNGKTVIVLIAAIFSACVAGLEGFLYYFGNFENHFAGISLTVRNIVTCFAFVPSLSITDVMKWISELSVQTGSSAELLFFTNRELYITLLKTVTNIYAAVIFLAPICTASAFYLFFYKLLCQIKEKLLPLTWKPPKERCLVICSGKQVKEMLLHENSRDLSREIYYVLPDEAFCDKSVNWIHRRIKCCIIDMVNCSDEKFCLFLKKIKSRQIDSIILCDTSDAVNFSVYIRMMTIGREYISENADIFCSCEEKTMEQLFINYYNDNRSKNCIAPKLFGIAKMRADSIFQSHPLPVVSSGEEFRILILGFGKTGQNILLGAIMQGVCTGDNPIIIDVVDSRIESKKDIFLKQFSSNLFTIKDNTCEVTPGQIDGRLEIRFHNLDIRGLSFLKLIDQNTYQHASVCIEDIEICLQCVLEVNRKIEQSGKKAFPIAVSLLSEPEIAMYLNNECKHYSNVYLTGIENYLTLDNILSKSTEKAAHAFHEIYRHISIEFSECSQYKQQEETEKDSDIWEKLSYYKQEENRCLSKHQHIKEALLRNYKICNPEFSLETFFGKDGTILKKNGKRFVFRDAPATLVKKLNADPFLREMGMMEHRRWCYSRAIDGWSYGTVKSEIKKESPYLVSWDDLCRTYPEMCIYDYMTFLMLMENMD